MSLRSLEVKVRPRVRANIVRRIVSEYLARAESEGHLPNPITYLAMPIRDAGYTPPGLQDAVNSLASGITRGRRQIIFGENRVILGVKRIQVEKEPLRSAQR